MLFNFHQGSKVRLARTKTTKFNALDYTENQLTIVRHAGAIKHLL